MTYDIESYKKILARLLKNSLENVEPAKELVEQVFDDEDFTENAKNICDTYMKSEHRNAKLISKTVDVRALSSLVKICKREKIGIIPIDFVDDEDIYSDDKTYQAGDQINVLVLSTQLEDLKKLILEAYAINGVVKEIKRDSAHAFAKKMNSENAMLEIKDVDDQIYKNMKKNMDRLPSSLKFTMFPEYNSNGKVNVGFLTKTGEFKVNKKSEIIKNGPYVIPKIASTLLACSLLTDPEKDREYEKHKKEKQKYNSDLMQLYYMAEEPFYLVPANIRKDNLLTVYMDNYEYIDSNSDYGTDSYQFSQYINSRNSGLNNLLIPMTEKEFLTFENELAVKREDLSLAKSMIIPHYMFPGKTTAIDFSERLIDMLNRKREEILLASEDLDGMNLDDLADYIVCTIQELIIREDDDYINYIERKEIDDTKENELLTKLERLYTISPVYENSDKVEELINTEKEILKKELEKERSKDAEEELEF